MATMPDVAYRPYYLGWRLSRLLTLAALGEDPEQYFKRFRGRLAQFLGCLINEGSPAVVYDLRLISFPDPAIAERGRIEVALLCRTDEPIPDAAEGRDGSIHRLLNVLFEEYTFEPIPADAMPKYLEPFPVRCIAEVRRRASLERLDTLRNDCPTRLVGFGADRDPEPADRAQDTVFHIYSFIPTFASFGALFDFMLHVPHPLAVSCRIRPTGLTPAEKLFLEEQIACCERYVQAEFGRASDDVSRMRPILKQQANLYQQCLMQTLLGLGDGAALMTLEIASPAVIPTAFADLLGTLVTEPPGGVRPQHDGGLHLYMSGGYDVRMVSGDPQAAEAFTSLGFALAPHRLAPTAADRLIYLFDPVEASGPFCLPPASDDRLPGLDVQSWQAQPPPRNLPNTGTLLGVSVYRAGEQAVRIGSDDRRRHVYVVGQTGTGKTTLLKTMILEDMRAGHGLCLIDPHGDLFKELLERVPPDRLDDVVVLDPTEESSPVGLNLLECASDDQRHFAVQEFVGIIARLMEDEYGDRGLASFAGPVFFQHMRMNLMLAMSNPEDPGTLLEFYNIYQSRQYWKRWIPLRIVEPLLERWVSSVLRYMDYTKPGSEGGSMGSYVGSKFEGFIFDPKLRHIFGQKRSTVSLRQVMDQGKILLVNLAKGELAEENARILGMILLAKLMAAAMERVRVPKDARREFHLYVDEFQSLATQSFVTLLSEARKFGVSLVLANQFVSQIKQPRIVQAIFGNVGTLVCFRLGQADAETMEQEFHPAFNRFDLANLPNWHACMSTLVNGQTVRPFSIQTIRDCSEGDPEHAEEVRARSRSKYGRAREDIEKEIAQSLQRHEAEDE